MNKGLVSEVLALVASWREQALSRRVFLAAIGPIPAGWDGTIPGVVAILHIMLHDKIGKRGCQGVFRIRSRGRRPGRFR
jgi:hypothetical protein